MYASTNSGTKTSFLRMIKYCSEDELFNIIVVTYLLCQLVNVFTAVSLLVFTKYVVDECSQNFWQR